MRFQFKHHLIDTTLPVRCDAQTAFADIASDGLPEFVFGQQRGAAFWYKRHALDTGTRHLLGPNSPSDIDGDGWLDFVAGAAGHRNSCDADVPVERMTFARHLTSVHDLFSDYVPGGDQTE